MEAKDSVTIRAETTRRESLKIMAGSAAAALGLPVLAGAAPQTLTHAAHAAGEEVAAGPNVLKYFSAQQAAAIDALAEVIIPADDHSPGAKAAAVHEYIDEIVGSSSAEVKKLWDGGLGAIERMARQEYGHDYARCTAAQQTALMERISRNEDHPDTLEEKFFGALKAAAIDGYYTSKIGIHQEIEYQGNTVLAGFSGCTHEEHKAG